MKLNWGTGIVITLTLFASLMSFMVYRAMQQDFDLVSENYYQEELEYQEVIDRKKNGLMLNEPAKIIREEGGIFLILPTDLQAQKKDIEVHMYYELEADGDFRFSLQNSHETRFEIPFTEFLNGKWIARVTVYTADKEYYFDPEIVL